MHDYIDSDLLQQVKSVMEIPHKCNATHHEQVIGFIIRIFFILEVLGQLRIIGIYFTDNIIGVYLSLFWLSVDISLQPLVGQRSNAGCHLKYTIDTPFCEYGIEDFHLCVLLTNDTVYAYSWVSPSLETSPYLHCKPFYHSFWCV